MQTKNNRKLLEYPQQYVDHHIEIVSHERDYSNADAREQAMLQSKTEERPSEKRVERKKKKKFIYICIYFFLSSSIKRVLNSFSGLNL